MEKKDFLGILVKATHDCNLNCEYCFDKTLREKYKGKIIDEEYIKKAADLVYDYASRVDWVWHGGEPTCAPMSVYENMQEYLYSKYDSNVSQTMQSNGTLFSKKWRDMALENDINVGISYDGINSLRNGKIPQGVVAENIREYSKYSDKYGTISVINETNYDKQIELYEELKDLGVPNIAFNHVFSTDRKETSEFLFDLKRYQEEYIKFSNYLFKNNLKLERTTKLLCKTVLGQEYHLCSHGDCRGKWLGLEPDGTIVPCDRFFPEKYHMGNIKDINSIDDAFNSQGYQLLCAEIEQKYINYCYQCPYFFHCNGGCNGDSVAKYGTAAKIDEFSCNWFKKSFNASYVLLRNIEGFSDIFLHKEIKDALVTEYRYLPQEIFDAIKENLNITVNLLSDEELLNLDDKIFDTKEFRIFRLFNPLIHDGINTGIGCGECLCKNNVDTARGRKALLNEFIQDNFAELLCILTEE